MEQAPATLIEVIQYFSDKKKCVEFVRDLHWPNGVTCPVCASKDVTELATRQLWQCKACRKQFSVKVGTIFEDSALPLQKWLACMWLMANAKNGISSHEIARSLGVTQKTAWFMSHRVREVLRTGSVTKLSGTVEVDETYIGGLEKNKHLSKRPFKSGPQGNKAIAMGMVERGGNAVAKVIDNTTSKSLSREIRANVESGAALYTDEWKAYQRAGRGYSHHSVNHGAGEYVRNGVHTNTVEGFWSLFKRCVKGTHIHMSTFHLDRYLDEECYRYNMRKCDDHARLEVATSRVFGRRLTYKELTGTAAAA